MNELNVDLSQHEESRGTYEPIPANSYRLFASDHSIEETRSGNGRFIKVVFEVADGEYKGRKVFENYNFENPNADTVRIAMGQIKSWVMAVGGTGNETLTPRLLEQLMGKEFAGKVGVQVPKPVDKEKGYGPQNRINNYSPLDPDALAQKEIPTDTLGGVQDAGVHVTGESGGTKKRAWD